MINIVFMVGLEYELGKYLSQNHQEHPHEGSTWVYRGVPRFWGAGVV